MKARSARRLAALYPRRWRERYGDEFTALLEDRTFGPSVLADVLVSALRERLMAMKELTMEREQKSVVLFGWAGLAALAASVNLYFSVDDTAVAEAMNANAAMSAAFSAVALGAAVALIAAGLLGVPIFFRLLAAAGPSGRWLFLKPFAIALVAALATGLWLAASGGISRAFWGGDWVPLPWNVGSDIVLGPPGWLRWSAGLVTLALLLAGLALVAIGIRRALMRHGQALRWSSVQRRLGIVLAIATLATAVASAVWGILAQSSAAPAFHGGAGFLASTIFVSWAASALLFIGGALLAGRGAAGIGRGAAGA